MEQTYSLEPEDKKGFTQSFNSFYSRFAKFYDIVVKLTPFWKRWLNHTLPYVEGPKVLEASFGTGYLLTQLAQVHETHGIDYNERMLEVALKNLEKNGLVAELQQANIESLPFPDKTFDSVVNTMAFSGYPDGRKALSEMRRVLKDSGKLILVDPAYPKDGNWLGTLLTRCWKSAGDIIRNIPQLLEEEGFDFVDKEIGGFGSIHLYVATPKSS